MSKQYEYKVRFDSLRKEDFDQMQAHFIKEHKINISINQLINVAIERLYEKVKKYESEK